ncbi:hypothetical protein NLI96_g5961 [Meripilus lineatus]|uniref:DUF6534 domain-containing protein n=1 Tax=Meripilus lineatus TaxID=2056292 RepID=A0AAD5V3V1_9APHY|nr:hypothetical protein NLI96_g5961 [Physisporinus lineatus]
MTAPPIPAGDTIHNTLGSLLLGNLAAGMFFGITIVQTHLFYVRGQQDHLAIKVLVSPLAALQHLRLISIEGFLALVRSSFETDAIDCNETSLSRIIDAFHLIAMSHSIYGFAVTNFGKYSALLFPDWGILAMVATGGISDAIVRGIYTFRIWRLGGNVWLVTLITMASLFVLGNVFAFIVEAKMLKDMISIARVSWILYLGFVAPAIADVFITLTLIVTLKHRRTGLEHTDSIIDALIYYSVQSGALTCILALICLVTHILKPYTYMSFGVYFLMPKVYLNALLATLNARKGLRSSRGRSRGRELVLMAFSKFQSRSARQNKRRREEVSYFFRFALTLDSDLVHLAQQDIRIQIETMTERASDIPHVREGKDDTQASIFFLLASIISERRT